MKKNKKSCGALVFAVILFCFPVPAFPATGAFSLASARPGDVVTLSGAARPGSAMSVYFYCNSGCGETHVGVANVDRNGRYSLTFRVPSGAKPGGAYVQAGCDTCGNGWTAFRGLTVAASQAPVTYHVGVLPPQPAPRPQIINMPPAVYVIGSRMNRLSLDVPNNSRSRGTGLETWRWKVTEGNDNQLFEFTSGSEIKVYGNMCLDSQTGKSGDAVIIWPCHGGANQKWNVTSGGEIISSSGKCVDIANGNPSPGGRIILSDCDGRQSQQWAFTRKPDRPEKCFGAIGPGCTGVANLKTPWGKNISIPAARDNGNGTYSQWVAVGSILHDNCCHSTRDPNNAVWCGESNLQNVAKWEASSFLGSDTLACAKEWRKAVYNVRDARNWWATFGPYDALHPYDNESDVAPVVNARFAMLSDYWGNFRWPYSGKESPQTSRLSAPGGTPLDASDVQFCASRQFKEEHWCGAMGCTDTNELAAAKKSVADWEDWARRIREGCDKHHYWATDPRGWACYGQITAAEPDHQKRIQTVNLLETKIRLANTHWGVCR